MAGERSEVAVISKRGPDDALIQSFVSQLLEQGIFLEFNKAQELPRDLPENLEGYKAVVLDEQALQAVLSNSESRERLETYARGAGFVFSIENPLGEMVSPMAINPNLVIDLYTTNLAYNMISLAGLTRRHPGLDRVQLDRPEEEMLADMKASVIERVKRSRKWGEFMLHWWKAALAFVQAGHEDVREVLLNAVRESCENMPIPESHDPLSGYFATAWYADQTGDRKPLEKARTLLDEVIARRPREMGVVTGVGFVDDPLGIRGLGFNNKEPGMPNQDWTRLRGLSTAKTTVRRKVIWTEALHMHGPAFAAISRATGDRKYLEEAIRLVDHVGKYHIREDGLIAHCTRDGQAVGQAWARGQTHALYGMIYMLEEMQRTDPAFDQILSLIERVGAALKRYQDAETGLWRNVIDHPSARLESSGTSGITYVYGRCIREGWLDRDAFEPMALKGWEGIKRFYWRRGLAANCRGTGVGSEDAYYLGRPQGWAVVPQHIAAFLEVRRLSDG